MKKVKILLFLSIFVSIFLCAGCGAKEISSAKIVRDDSRVGGSLSFVYDQKERKIFVGGEGEVIQFSEGDEALGFDAGTRVGLKVIAPDEKLDLSSAKFEMNGVNLSAEDFLEKVDGQLQRFFNIYPLVTKQNPNVKFSVTWQDGTKEQTYVLQVVEGTKFLDENGEIG